MPRTAKFIARRAQTLIAVLAAITVVTFLGRFHWLAELTTHFEIQYLSGALLLTPLAYLGDRPSPRDEKPAGQVRRRIFLALGLALIALHGARVGVWYFPIATAAANDAPPLRLMTANVNADNNRYDDLIAHVRAVDPHLVLLQEVDLEWAKALEELKPQYPYWASRPRKGFYGIVTLSRIPLVEADIVDFAGLGIPGTHALIEWNGKQVSILNYHTAPPASPELSGWRNTQLQALYPYPDTQNGPCIVAGDFNLTMWSPQHADLLRETGLLNARKGFGPRPTWRASLWTLFGLPIDQVFHTKEITTLHFEVLPHFGSDHRPLLVNLAI